FRAPAGFAGTGPTVTERLHAGRAVSSILDRIMHAGRCIARIVRASVFLTLPASAVAQDVSSFLHHLPNHVVLPQRHVIIVPPAPHPLPHPLPRSGDVRLVGGEADASIRSGIATTAPTIRLENPGHARAE